MPQITSTNLQVDLEKLISDGIDPLQVVVVEEHPDYPGELVFQTFENQVFFQGVYKRWISNRGVLNELFNLNAFLAELETDGWVIVFAPSTEMILADYQRWSLPLEIEGYNLHSFQSFSLHRAYETNYWFLNWGTGAGKSFTCVAGAKYLLERGEIDVVVFCTLSKAKINQARFFRDAGLDAVVNDGTKPKRVKVYAEHHQVYVMNYEKLNFDAKEITLLTMERNVLWIFDECQKLVSADIKKNKARLCFEKMNQFTVPNSKVWPMSASVVNGDPLRFRDVFGLGQKGNPLGTKLHFEMNYADEVKTIPIKTAKGRTFDLTVYDWNHAALQEVRHRVGSFTQVARKTDPGIAPLFKGLQTLVEPIQPSAEDLALSEYITDRAWEVYQRGENLGPYYSLLRYLCNTPEALLHTDHEAGKEIAKEFAQIIPKLKSSKIDRLNEQLQSIRDEGDQCLVFTHFTTLTLHLLKDKIEVPHVVHYGAGQSDKASQQAQDDFKANPDITCFFTSDAGAYALNMQNSRTVIQLEPTYSYDDGMQRASRIDRSDSHLDGLQNIVYVTEGSVEERVWAINNDRRILNEVIQGSEEVLSYGPEFKGTGNKELAKLSEGENLVWLLFGDRT
jgi:hypothetical protein